MKAKVSLIFQKIQANERSSKKGELAIDFTYPDQMKICIINRFERQNSVRRHMGTWCGPCKSEIPYLQRLQEEFSDDELVFLSVSVDEKEDKQKWLQMIDEKNLGGIHLHTSDGIMN